MSNKKENKILIYVFVGVFIVLLLYSIRGKFYIKGNENTEIILYKENGAEIVYTNPTWYRVNKNGITFEKDGKRIIAGKNYEVVINLEDK